MSNHCLSKVEDQIQQYFNSQHKQALAKTTKTSYKGVARSKLIPFCELNGINELDGSFVDHMDDLVEFLQENGNSGRTIQSYLTIIKSFLRFHGHEIKYTYRIPRADKQENDLKHENRWFSENEIAQIRTYRFRVNHNRNHLFVRLLLETGARVNEIANIRVKDIKILAKMIKLTESKTVPRPVFFGSETAIYLSRLLNSNYPDQGKDSLKKIFPGKNMLYKIITEMLNNLKIKSPCDGRGPHTFRHYVATDMVYRAKTDLVHVAKLLGDTPTTISQNYLHPTAEMLQSIMSKASGW